MIPSKITRVTSSHCSLTARLLLILLMGLSISCSVISGRTPTDAEKRVVLGLSAGYLQAVVMNNIQKLEETILWSDYLMKGGRQAGKVEYFRQVATLQNMWNLDDNPLLGLTLLDLQIRRDTASVTLHKKGTPEDQTILVELMWIGHGWLVINDNIFGDEGLLKGWIENRRAI